MAGFVDNDPTAPVIYYELPDGQRIPLPRPTGLKLPDVTPAPAPAAPANAAAGKWVGGQFVPGLAEPPPPPDVEMPAEDVPPAGKRGIDEDAYRAWMTKIGHTKANGFNVDDAYNGTDYDYRGFYAKYGPVDVRKGQHLTDEFKLPNHPTFSNESIYAVGDKAPLAGHWEGDKFIPSPIGSVTEEQRGTPLPGQGPDAVSGAGARVAPTGEVLAPPTPDQPVTPDLAPEPPDPEEVAAMGHAKVAQEKADAEYNATQAANVARENDAYTRDRQRQAEAAQAKARSDDYLATLDKLAKSKIEPDRYWHDMSTGRKIGTVMMALVSGFGSVLKHQGDKNPALDLIMDAMRRDVALQMDARDKLAADVGRKRDAFDAVRQQASDREAEYQGRLSIVAQQQADRFQEIAAKAQRQDVAYQYLDVANQLRAAGQAAGAAAAQREFENRLKIFDAEKTQAETEKLRAETAKLRGQLGGGGAGAAAGGQYVGLTDAQMQGLKPRDRDRAVRMPDGSWALTKDKDAAKAADQQLADSRVMVQNIDRVLTKLSDSGLVTKLESKIAGDVDEGTAVVQQELTQLMANGKNFLQLGAISESDMKLISNLGADPAQVTNVIQQIRPKLENWRRGIVDDASTRVQQYGVDVSKASYGEAPKPAPSKTSGETFEEITSEPPPTTRVQVKRQRTKYGSWEVVGEETVPAYQTPTRADLDAIEKQMASEGNSPDQQFDAWSKLRGIYRDKRSEFSNKYNIARAERDELEDKDGKPKKGKEEAWKAADQKAKALVGAMSDYDQMISIIDAKALKIGKQRAEVDVPRDSSDQTVFDVLPGVD